MTNFLNIHFPDALSEQDFEMTITDRWAHPAFFDETHESHDRHALTTLGSWIKQSTRFRHVPTGTWRGGPRGVRWPLAVLAGLVTNLTAIEMNIRVPEAIKKVEDPMFQKRAWNQIAQLVEWMIRSVDQSIDILSKTYDQRATAWKEGVLAEYQKGQGYAALLHSARSTPAVEVTSGLPSDPAELHAYAQKLIQQRVDVSPVTSITLSNLPPPPQPGPSAKAITTKRTLKAKKQSDRSVEEYDLDDIGSSSEDRAESPVLSSSGEGAADSSRQLLFALIPRLPRCLTQVQKIPTLYPACTSPGPCTRRP